MTRPKPDADSEQAFNHSLSEEFKSKHLITTINRISGFFRQFNPLTWFDEFSNFSHLEIEIEELM